MSVDGDEALDYEFISGTDGELQLVARDPEASWVVVQQHGDGPPEVLARHAAEGEVAHYRGLLGHPAWYVSRGQGRALYVFTEGRAPQLLGSPGGLGRTDSFVCDVTSVQRSVLEAASWRLAAELCRRHPDRLRIYELHPGGGQYDCLSIAVAGESPRSLIQLNRNGSIHIEGRWDGRAPQVEPRSWTAYLAEDRSCSYARSRPTPPCRPRWRSHRRLRTRWSTGCWRPRRRSRCSGVAGGGSSTATSTAPASLAVPATSCSPTSPSRTGAGPTRPWSGRWGSPSTGSGSLSTTAGP